MRRSFAASEPAPDDFSGVLERLARTVSEESSGVRQLSPVAEPEARRGRSASEAVLLSYEQALRTHTRYPPPASVAAPATGATAKASAAATTEANSPLPDRATDRIAAPVAGKAAGPAKSRSRGRGASSGRRSPEVIAPFAPSGPSAPSSAARLPDAAGAAAGKPANKPANKPASKTASTTARVTSQTAPEAKPGASPATPLISGAPKRSQDSKTLINARQETKAVDAGERGDRAEGEQRGGGRRLERKVGRGRLSGKMSGKMSGKSDKTLAQPSFELRERSSIGEMAGKPVGVASPSAKKMALELPRLSVASPSPTALEFRHSSVTVRLSAEESEQLRQRAIESGLSVSAYMRSCVLEADHLRFQVKQALAQMRARTPAVASDASLVPALGYEERTGPWSRLLSKWVMFFLGPWYPLRKSA